MFYLSDFRKPVDLCYLWLCWLWQVMFSAMIVFILSYFVTGILFRFFFTSFKLCIRRNTKILVNGV